MKRLIVLLQDFFYYRRRGHSVRHAWHMAKSTLYL